MACKAVHGTTLGITLQQFLSLKMRFNVSEASGIEDEELEGGCKNVRLASKKACSKVD